jgi:peptide-methionine (R)-S-oxide reductase
LIAEVFVDEASRSRRGFLLGALMTPAMLAVGACARAAGKPKPLNVEIENFSAAGRSLGRVTVARVVKTEEEWRKQLSPESFTVTRHEGTERPYSGKHNENHDDGIYRCICCDTALFDSKTKFESGTGWPSFWKPISNANVSEIVDNSMMMSRTAVECKRCDAHLGHVFEDGPDPTGLRYCMNSVSLDFVPRAKA